MDELVRWLGEQLDEDERIAREATPGPWRNAPTARHHATASGRSEEAVFASPPDVGAMVVAATGEASERRNLVDAEFIARHDPARVLREIDAKRQILDEHKPGRPKGRPNMERHCPTCATAHAWDETANEANCLTLRLLALPYADRPDYREEWRP